MLIIGGRLADAVHIVKPEIKSIVLCDRLYARKCDDLAMVLQDREAQCHPHTGIYIEEPS